MKFLFLRKLLLIPCLLFTTAGISQYILNGSAKKNSCNCYTLTEPQLTQIGSVWNSNKISLSNSFDFWFNVYLGCLDANGADGIVFMLQPLSTSIGTSGEGMGFSGVTPSIGIALDTWQNANQNDPSFDHISIQANGQINHINDLAGPVPISATNDNVEDCRWHRLRISWDAGTHWLRAYFDGNLRVEKQIDLVGTIFHNDPSVYWGFTGATGGAFNLQQFCTALNPDFVSSVQNNAGCAGVAIQFKNQSESFAPIATYDWSFGDGSTANSEIPSPHVYAKPGAYTVNLRIKGIDGCENDTTKTVTIGSQPDAAVNIYDTCYLNSPRISFKTNNYGVTYRWVVDGNAVAGSATPDLQNLQAGKHDVQLIVESLYQCGDPDTSTAFFNIKAAPEISASKSQACDIINFAAKQLDQQTKIIDWKWKFGDNQQSALQNPVHKYLKPEIYTATIQATADNGCTSNQISLPVQIPFAYAFAGNDTIIVRNVPFQLNGSGNGAFLWSPSTSLSDATVPNPRLTLSGNQDYVLKITTDEGCIASDTIHIKAIEGPMVYVPTAFTPNADGLNDILQPIYVGITKIERFIVYSRWGQTIFSTSDMKKGWDGKIGSNLQPTGTYVWQVKAENYLKQPVLLKGTVTLMR